ncbi:hypothetical protein [Enterococcus sp. CSURQ0835]|nr:hypothetical protein [Enterococcus sp. CSURQ0835]
MNDRKKELPRWAKEPQKTVTISKGSPTPEQVKRDEKFKNEFKKLMEEKK